ncbi:MAG: hypothetical protein LAT65_05485 [Saccharospirillum sp.]|nr:hypothetical protein [Saccharospirillum sp.]
MILKLLRIVIALLLVVLVWLIAMGNNQLVALTFMGWTTPGLPLFVWLLSVLFAGLVLGVVLGRFSGGRAKR